MSKKLSPMKQVIKIFTKAGNPEAEMLLEAATTIVQERRPAKINTPAKRGRPPKISAPETVIETE